jgi:hypothetical protein
MRIGVALVVLALGSMQLDAHAESLNVKFGSGAAPSPTYAAAGLPGVWNVVQGQSSPQVTYHLVGLDGQPTAVTLYQYGGNLVAVTDPSVNGDDARLLNDSLVTHDPGLESCLFINGLRPGLYEVTTYAWMPNAPNVRSRVRHDLSTRIEDVGGAWSGMHVEGVTYARHLLMVGSNGFVGSHSGIVPGAIAANGAALNGVQLREIVPGTDAGSGTGPDAGPTGDAAGDAAVRDAAFMDAAAIDATAMDAAAIDATAMDATAMDATAMDATAMDAAVSDAVASDAGASDTGASDAAPVLGDAGGAEPNDGGQTIPADASSRAPAVDDSDRSGASKAGHDETHGCTAAGRTSRGGPVPLDLLLGVLLLRSARRRRRYQQPAG